MAKCHDCGVKLDRIRFTAWLSYIWRFRNEKAYRVCVNCFMKGLDEEQKKKINDELIQCKYIVK